MTGIPQLNHQKKLSFLTTRGLEDRRPPNNFLIFKKCETNENLKSKASEKYKGPRHSNSSSILVTNKIIILQLVANNHSNI
jgi:hypothetical protein